MEALPSRLDIAVEVGRKIREERESRDWSLELLAGLAGIGKSTLGQIEVGQNVPQVDTMIRIAAAFGLSVEQFLPKDYVRVFAPKVVAPWRDRETVAGSSRPSSIRSSNTNARRGSQDPSMRRKLGRRTSKRSRREGGFSTPAPLPATMLARTAIPSRFSSVAIQKRERSRSRPSASGAPVLERASEPAA